jgi:hypothetical protein
VNLSPKGLENFRGIDPQTVAYLDLTASGIETVDALAREGSTCERPQPIVRGDPLRQNTRWPETGSISA